MGFWRDLYKRLTGSANRAAQKQKSRKSSGGHTSTHASRTSSHGGSSSRPKSSGTSNHRGGSSSTTNYRPSNSTQPQRQQRQQAQSKTKQAYKARVGNQRATTKATTGPYKATVKKWNNTSTQKKTETKSSTPTLDKMRAKMRNSTKTAWDKTHDKNNKYIYNAVGGYKKTDKLAYGDEKKSTRHIDSRSRTTAGLSKGAIPAKVKKSTSISTADQRRWEEYGQQQKIRRETEEKKKTKSKEAAQRVDDSIRREIAYNVNKQYNELKNEGVDISKKDRNKAFDEIYKGIKNDREVQASIRKYAKKVGKQEAKAYNEKANKELKDKVAEKYGKSGVLKSEQLTPEEYLRLDVAQKIGGKVGTASLGKELAEKVGSRTAYSAGRNTISKGVAGALQGIAFADVEQGGVGTYNKAAKEVLKNVRESTAYNVGYGVGQVGGFAVGGVGQAGRGIVRGIGEKAAKELLVDTLSKRMTKEAATNLVGRISKMPNANKLIEKSLIKNGADLSKIGAKTTLGKGAQNTVADMAASLPMDVMDAAKMSRDENGNIDKKSFAAMLALNVGIGGAAGGALESGSAALMRNNGKKLVKLQAKANAGTATQDEIKEMQSLYAKAFDASKDYTATNSNIAKEALGRSDLNLSEAIKGADAREYFRLKAIQSERNLLGKENKRMQELNKQMELGRIRYENNLQTVVAETKLSIGKSSAVDVARLRKADAYYTATGNKAAAKEARNLLAKAEKNFENTLGTVEKAAARVSHDLGREYKIENSQEILDSFARTGGSVQDPSQFHGFAEFDEKGNIVAYHVNKDSEQAMEFTFGHEFTHGFESLGDSYKEFKENLKSFVGDEWGEELARVEANYKNVANANYENEVVANLVAKHFFANDGAYLKKLAGENPSLFARIYDMVKKLVKGSTETDTQLEALSKQMDTMFETLSENNKSIALGTPETTEMLFGGGRSLQDILDSGVNTATAQELKENLSEARNALKYAIKQSDGDAKELAKARKQIFKDYGWFQGHDGKWRYEIDDSRMKFTGGMKISDTHKDGSLVYYDSLNNRMVAATQETVAEVNSRIDKLLSKSKLTKKETDELKGLRKQLKFRKLFTKDGLPLGSVIEHEEFFKLYPDARGIRFKLSASSRKGFGDIKETDRGFTAGAYVPDPTGNTPGTLYLNAHLLSEDTFLHKVLVDRGDTPSKYIKEVMIHELQHYVQEIEGFAEGGNSNMFKQSIEEDDVLFPKHSADKSKLDSLRDDREDLTFDMESIDEGGLDEAMSAYLDILAKSIHDPKRIQTYQPYGADKLINARKTNAGIGFDDYFEDLGGYHGYDNPDLSKIYTDTMYSDIKSALGVPDNGYIVNKEFDDLFTEYLRTDFSARQLAESDPSKLYKRLAGENEAFTAQERTFHGKPRRKRTFPMDDDLDPIFAKNDRLVSKDAFKRSEDTVSAKTELSYGIDYAKTEKAGGKVTTSDPSYGYAVSLAEDLEQNGHGADYIAEKTELIRNDSGDWVIADLAGKYDKPNIESLTNSDYAIISHQIFEKNVSKGRLEEDYLPEEITSFSSDSNHIVVADSTGGANSTFKYMTDITEQERTVHKETYNGIHKVSEGSDVWNENAGDFDGRRSGSDALNKYGREGGTDDELVEGESASNGGRDSNQGDKIQPGDESAQQKIKSELSYGTLSDEESAYYDSIAASMPEEDLDYGGSFGDVSEAPVQKGVVSNEVREQIKTQSIGGTKLTDEQIDQFADAQQKIYELTKPGGLFVPKNGKETVKELKEKFGMDDSVGIMKIRRTETSKNGAKVYKTGELYEELSKDYPSLFPESIKDEAEQLKRLMEVTNLKGGLKKGKRGSYFMPRNRTFEQNDWAVGNKPKQKVKQFEANAPAKAETAEAVKMEEAPKQEPPKAEAPKKQKTETKPKTETPTEQTPLPKGEPKPKEEPATIEETLENAKKGYITTKEMGDHAKKLGESWSSEVKVLDDAFKKAAKKGQIGQKKMRAETYDAEFNKAVKAVDEDFDKVWNRVMSREDGIVETPQSAAEKHALMRKLVERAGSGDENAAMLHLKLIDKMDSGGSLAGHMLQLQSYVLKDSPNGRLRYMLRQVKRMNKEYADVLKGKELELTPEEVRKILDAKTPGDAAKVSEEIGKRLWKEVPSGFLEGANQIRHWAMLFNPKTHGRNIGGNLVFKGAREMSNALEIAATRVAQKTSKGKKLLGDDAIMSKTISRRELSDTKDILNKRFNDDYLIGEQHADRWAEGKRSAGYLNEQTEGVLSGARNTVAKVINKLIDVNYNLLDIEDRLFFRPAYKKEYLRYCKSKGFTENVNGKDVVTAKSLEAMSDADMKAATDWAMEKARIATFRDDSAISERIIQWKQATEGAGKTPLGKAGYRALNVGMESVLPFVKTPVNILRRGTDYSPIGLFRGVSESIAAKDADAFMNGIHQLSTGLTGTGVFALGWWAAQHEWVTVEAGEVSGDAYYDRDMGYQDYSLKVHVLGNDYSASMDWLAPMQFAFFQGAAVNNEKGGEWDTEKFLTILEASVKPMMEMSFMSSAKDTAESFFERAYRDGTGSEASMAEAIGRTLFGSMPQGWLGSFVPQLVNQSAGFSDNLMRDTSSTEADEFIKSWQSWGRQLQNRIPGLRQQLNPKLNRKGEDVSNEGVNIITKFANAFANPANVKKITLDKYDQEIIDIYNNMEDGYKKNYFLMNFTGNPSLDLANGKRMTYEDKYTYAKSSRTEQWDGVKRMVDAPSYEVMTDSMKQKEVDNLHWIGNMQGDYTTYGANYAIKAMKNGDNARDEGDAKLFKRYTENAGASKDKDLFVQWRLDKERLLARSHTDSDDTYRVKGLTAIRYGDANLLKAVDLTESKQKDLTKYWGLIKKDHPKSDKKAWDTAFEEVSNFFCRTMANIDDAGLEGSNLGIKSASAGMVAKDGRDGKGTAKQFLERTYRGMGHTWNSAQAGGGIMLKYNKDGKYSLKNLEKMTNDLNTKLSEKSDDVTQKDVAMAYIENDLGITDRDEAACLYQVLYIKGHVKGKTAYKNPYKDVIDDHLRWGKNHDDEWDEYESSGGGYGGWGRRGGYGGWGGGGWGYGGGGGSSTGAMTDAAPSPAKVSDNYKATGKATIAKAKSTKAKVSAVAVKDYTKPSNLTDAYRKRARKLRNASRKMPS